jgi:PLP dependent protein
VASKTPLADKLKEVQDRIARACTAAKRDPTEVTLIAVTKYAAPEVIRELLKLGVADLGESRVQQLVQRAAQINEFHQRLLTSKDESVAPKLRWHMIGHLQRNKAKQVLPLASVIHSVDSLRLAEELDAALEKQNARATTPVKKYPVLIQVNASEESQKSGVAVGATLHLAEQIATMPSLQVAGLMTMARHDAPEAECRQNFARVRELFEELKWNKIGGAGLKHLSMGMTQDYEWAILEGATLVRVGSALFGGKPEGDADEDE